MERIFICGDVHGHFSAFSEHLKKLAQAYPEDMLSVFVCGDFGYWPLDLNMDKDLIVPDNVVVYFCPGNHEDWESLNKLKLNDAGMREVHPRVWYCSFGSTLTVRDKYFMFLGGAESVDRFYRVPDVSWFKDEGISEEAMSELLSKKIHRPIDAVISHTCPDCVRGDTIMVCGRIYPVFANPDLGNSEEQLERFNKIHKPKSWFYGHFHVRNTIKDKDQVFEALGDMYLPKHEWMMEYEDGSLEVQAIDQV